MKKETKKPNSNIFLGSGQECQDLLPAVYFHHKVINSAMDQVIVEAEIFNYSASNGNSFKQVLWNY